MEPAPLSARFALAKVSQKAERTKTLGRPPTNSTISDRSACNYYYKFATLPSRPRWFRGQG